MFSFDRLCEASQMRILIIAKNNSDYARMIGYYVGLSFPKLKSEIKNKVLEVVIANPVFAIEFGKGIKNVLENLDEESREKLMSLAKINQYLYKGLTSSSI
ncbi:hypothetical protein [Saccharolobus caldissimus]|uniref:Uncharacterized protein n=1 Tax=Saccharolobus caldissimus TaxID=1702097 RepID=A0AAQ4CQQ7_9CREN|nr:hypothetical protein [Saccharolobus caldissimus]BDB98138.1 hypothetical protein SACC_11550 [Saccharolobus caldissimus]